MWSATTISCACLASVVRGRGLARGCSTSCSVSSLKKCAEKSRRSARIANLTLLSSNASALFHTSTAPSGRNRTCEKVEGCDSVMEGELKLHLEHYVQEVLEGKKTMDDHESVGGGYSTNGSSDSFYGVHVDTEVDGKNSFTDNSFATQFCSYAQAPSSSALCVDSEVMHLASAFGPQFQNLVLRALFQATGTLIGPSLGVMSSAQGLSSGSPLISTPQLLPASTWNEATYHKSEGRRKKMPEMRRTSAGEKSDSQEDFRVPQNESPQQRSLRIRRLNRFRSRRAKELSSNRKAVNKVPYVIHIDGLGKAKGIHKHQWRRAVRGQCGRLDPTMDNINHHPKHIVDSIWHALEKEWEFQGFAHRAREMFEKSATKFMRNRKMQLKYKCQKNVDGPKPDDVSAVYWAKIVDLTKKSMKESMSSRCRQGTSKGKERIPEDVEDNKMSTLRLLGTEIRSRSGSPNAKSLSPSSKSRLDSVRLEENNVDARIRSLQRELLSLQKSRKDEGGSGGRNAVGQLAVMSFSDRAVEAMKENVKPVNGNSQGLAEAPSGINLKKIEVDLKGKAVIPIDEKKLPVLKDASGQEKEDKSAPNMNEVEMDCGDIVRLFAVIDGRKKEIGKGILMGLAGSKHARKVIPKGWRSIKVTSYTFNGAIEACPFPSGWAEQVKHQTVREAMGRTVLWPDTLLHSLLHM